MNIYSILMIAAGVFNFMLVLKVLKNDEFAKNYVANSPKAWLWRKMLGEEKAYKLLKKVFAPIGMVISVLLIIGGLATLLMGV